MDARLGKIMEKIKNGEEFCVYESFEAYQYLQEIASKCAEYNALNIATQSEEQLASFSLHDWQGNRGWRKFCM